MNGEFATTPRGNPVFIVAIAIGLALRLAFSLGYWTHQPLTRDEREYLSLARGLASGRGFTYDMEVLGGQTDPFGRAPAYPLFLAAAGGGRSVPSSVPTSVKIAQSIVGACGVWLIGLVAGRLAGQRAASFAALLAAVYPPLVWTAAFALSEAIAWPAALAVAWLFDRAVLRFQRSGFSASGFSVVAAGLAGGLLVLIRPASIFFLGVAGLWLLWKRRLAVAALLACGALAAIAPWTIRNINHYGRFVFVASEGGVTFWTGNHPHAVGEGDLAANPHLKLDSQRLRAEHADRTEEQMEPVYYREAFSWIASHPGNWLKLEARKLFYLIVPIGPSSRVHSARYKVAALASYLLLLPLAVVGFILLGERRQQSPGLWLLAGSAMLMSLVFFPQDRFRMSVIDPALIVCAGAVRSSRSPDVS